MLAHRNFWSRKAPTLQEISNIGLGEPFFYISADSLNLGTLEWLDLAGGLVGSGYGGVSVAKDMYGHNMVLFDGSTGYFDFGQQNFFDEVQAITVVVKITSTVGFAGDQTLIGQRQTDVGDVWCVERTGPINDIRLNYRAGSGVTWVTDGGTSKMGWYGKPRIYAAGLYSIAPPGGPGAIDPVDSWVISASSASQGTTTMHTDLATIRDVRLTVGAALLSAGVPRNLLAGGIEWVGLWRARDFTKALMYKIHTIRNVALPRNSTRVHVPSLPPGLTRYINPSWWEEMQYTQYPRLGSEPHSVGDIVWDKLSYAEPAMLRKVLFVRGSAYYTEEVSGGSTDTPARYDTSLSRLISAGDTIEVVGPVVESIGVTVERDEDLSRYTGGVPVRIVRSGIDAAARSQFLGADIDVGGMEVSLTDMSMDTSWSVTPNGCQYIYRTTAHAIYCGSICTSMYGVRIQRSCSGSSIRAYASALAVDGSVSLNPVLLHDSEANNFNYITATLLKSWTPTKRPTNVSSMVDDNRVYKVNNTYTYGLDTGNTKPLYVKSHAFAGVSYAKLAYSMPNTSFTAHTAGGYGGCMAMTADSYTTDTSDKYPVRDSNPDFMDAWREWVIDVPSAEYYDITFRFLYLTEDTVDNVAAMAITYRDIETNFKIYRDRYTNDPATPASGIVLDSDDIGGWSSTDVDLGLWTAKKRTVRINDVGGGRVVVRINVFPYNTKVIFSPVLEVV